MTAVPTLVEVRAGAISIDEVVRRLGLPADRSDAAAADTEAGALVTFSGIVRGTEEGAAISGLAYEHYAGMAEAQMQRLAGEASARWHLRAVALVHRVGLVPPGEPSVIVAAASGHRAAAFDAARHLIDELKARVPIWKAVANPVLRA